MNGNIPRMDWSTKAENAGSPPPSCMKCCNYDSGNCLLLEDGEPLRVQVSAIPLLCRWFTAAVLPLDEALKPPSCAGEAGNAAPSARRSFPPNPAGEIPWFRTDALEAG